MATDNNIPVGGLLGTAASGLPVSTSVAGYPGITADSEPNCDSWGPDSFWSADEWLAYHKALVLKYGAQTAGAKWGAAFDNCAGYLGAEINYASKNDSFKKYVTDNNLAQYSTKITQVFKAINWGDSVHAPFVAIGNAIGNTAQAINNLAAGANNATASTSTIFKILPWILLAGGVVFGIILLTRESKKA